MIESTRYEVNAVLSSDVRNLDYHVDENVVQLEAVVS